MESLDGLKQSEVMISIQISAIEIEPFKTYA